MPDDFRELLNELSSVTGDVATSSFAEGIEYRRTGQLFALGQETGAVELRLRPDIAEAARRTPDTSVSDRGDEWVRFTPAEWDDHARDRLEAWFRVAWRFAGDSER